MMVKSVTITEDDYRLMTLIKADDPFADDFWFNLLHTLFDDEHVEFGSSTEDNIITAVVMSIRNRGGVVREDD